MLDPYWLDEGVMDDRASYMSAHIARQQSFRQDIINHDGTCLDTNGRLSGLPHHSGESQCVRIPPQSFQAYSSPSIFRILQVIGEYPSSHLWRASMIYGTDCCSRLLCTVLLGILRSHFCESVICCIPIFFTGYIRS